MKGSLSVRMRVRNSGQHRSVGALSINLFDAEGRVSLSRSSRVSIPQGGTTQRRFKAALSRIEPWSPESPALYRLEASLVDRDDGPVDLCSGTCGFRSIRAADGRLLLNGAPIFLKGFNRHEQYGDLGTTDPDEWPANLRCFGVVDRHRNKKRAYDAMRACYAQEGAKTARR